MTDNKNRNHGRILGLDYGTKTVGVAISDQLFLTAQELETIVRERPNKLRRTLARIEELCQQYEVESIVLGFPKNMDDSEGFRCDETLEFKAMLEKHNVESEILKSLNINQTIEVISNLEYLVAMRFHACLVGAKAGVKVLGINYDVKVETLAMTINFPHINLENEINNEKFIELMNLDTNNYQIPTFNFESIFG